MSSMAIPSHRLSELDGGPLTIDPSIYPHMAKGLQRNPNSPAIIIENQNPDHLSKLVASNFSEKGDNECLTWTHAQLHSAALKVSSGLLAQGIKPRDTLATFMPNCVEWTVLLWVSAILKLNLAGLDPGALMPARKDELRNLLKTLEPKVVVSHSARGAQVLDEVLKGLNTPAPKVKLCMEDCGNDSAWVPFEELEAPEFLSQAQAEAHRPDDPDRIVAVLFTSGTSSGTPKGCPRHCAAMCHGFDANPYDLGDVDGSPPRLLLTTPNYRAIAPTVAALIWGNGGVVVMPRPAAGEGMNIDGFLETIERWRVSTLVLIPMMLHLMVASPKWKTTDLSFVGAVMMGADVVDRSAFNKLHRAFPRTRVSLVHGMTELNGPLTWPFHGQAPDTVPSFGDIMPIGVPSAGIRLRIRDPENGRTTKIGEPGELVFCGPSVFRRYMNDVSAQSFYSEGGEQWFRTGDLAVIDNDGIVYILSRLKDVIKRGGLSVAPPALENCISSFIGVGASVVAAAHPIYGQEPFAVVKMRNGKTDDEIAAQIVEVFGKEYRLGGVASLEELGLADFPLNATAKVQKFELARRVAELISSRQAAT